jgi:hypothetical protein
MWPLSQKDRNPMLLTLQQHCIVLASSEGGIITRLIWRRPRILTYDTTRTATMPLSAIIWEEQATTRRMNPCEGHRSSDLMAQVLVSMARCAKTTAMTSKITTHVSFGRVPTNAVSTSCGCWPDPRYHVDLWWGFDTPIMHWHASSQDNTTS